MLYKKSHQAERNQKSRRAHFANQMQIIVQKVKRLHSESEKSKESWQPKRLNRITFPLRLASA